MYSVGIFSNISELTTFPFANIKEFAEYKFLQNKNYEFSLYTKDQKEIFLAKVQTGGFDGIVFATNTANDATLKEFFEDNKDAFTGFLEAGKGILILLQCQAAIDNSFFNILTEKDFPGLKGTIIQTKHNINERNEPFDFNEKTMEFRKITPILFNYPREVLGNEEDTYSILRAMKYNNWYRNKRGDEKQEITSPFAYISSYPEDDFYSVIDYNNDQISGQKSFCIISRNANKRVAITTLALDLEQNYFLENLISYIARGEPSVFFRPCGDCGRCDFVDLLYNTKIHFSDNEQIRPLVKYEILTCGKSYISANEKYVTNDENEAIPTKQLMPIANSSGQICRCVNTSSVRYMCKLGAQYLKTRLKNGKYGSLIGTLTTLRLFKMIGFDMLEEDVKAILGYLEKHNKDGKSFDNITRSTNIAAEILKILKEFKYKKKEFQDYLKRENEKIKFAPIQYKEDKKQQDCMGEEKTIDPDYLKTRPINEVAKILGNFDFKTLIKNEEMKECFLVIFAKIVSSKDVDKISWENDCYMTALMLIVLLKIENWLVEFDKKYSTNCVAKINTIATYFEESSETSLYNELVESADSERKNAYTYSLKLQEAEQKNLKLKTEKEELESEKRDFESVEKRVAQHQTINIMLATFVLSAFVLGIILGLRAKFSDGNLYDFLMGLQPISLILSAGALIVVPITIGSMYWLRVKIKSKEKKKEEKKRKEKKNDEAQTSENNKNDESRKSRLSNIKDRRNNKNNKNDESQTS